MASTFEMPEELSPLTDYLSDLTDKYVHSFLHHRDSLNSAEAFQHCLKTWCTMNNTVLIFPKGMGGFLSGNSGSSKLSVIVCHEIIIIIIQSVV